MLVEVLWKLGLGSGENVSVCGRLNCGSFDEISKSFSVKRNTLQDFGSSLEERLRFCGCSINGYYKNKMEIKISR